MAREIERKFLPRNEAWRGLAPGTAYVQGYLAGDAAAAVRVRIAGDAASLNVKGNVRGATTGAVRDEFEYAIPLEDARQMLAMLDRETLIEKTRYRIEYRGLYWEVDEFHGTNQGLVVAEIELAHEDQAFEKPDWIGEEVTDDPRYYNARLARVPYSAW